MNDKKEKYTYPTIEVIEINDSDYIITTSTGIFGPEYDDGGESSIIIP